MAGEMDEVVEEFLVESFENLDQLDRDLLALEQDPENRDAIASIFRIVHTVKGTCGFLGFTKLEEITHVGENLLSQLRDGTLTVDARIADALLALGDAIREILGTIERDGAEGDTDYAQLVQRLSALQQGASDAAPPTVGDDHADATQAAPQSEADAAPPVEDPRIGEQLVAEGRASEVDVALGLIEQDQGDPRRLGEILVEQGVVEPAHVREALERQADQRAGITDSTIRVDVALLDDLMNLVGELVLARNQLMQWGAERAADSVFVNTSQRLNLITTELQARMMKTRMQPVGNVWGRFPRVVRDLASKFSKQVAVVMEGSETELDKTVIEAIKDPLTHLVRNSVDHGIELPEDRARAGKPRQGTLSLRAYHEGGQVILEIADDGKGIDVERVKAKAVERGLVPEHRAAELSDREATQLIFLPGFSTAEAVTSVSGRGVGMDVVKTNIERIGGSLEVVNHPGEGTTFRIKIPLTLAIIPALVVSAGGHRFAIPQVNLLELVRLDGAAGGRIEHVQGAPVYRLRGEILPIVSLHDELDLELSTSDADLDAAGEGVSVVVLQAEDRQFGLVVDDVHDTEEIVVKPLSPQLEAIDVFSGCTIMGDGTVALILDVVGLAHRAGVLAERREGRITDTEGTETATHTDDEVTLLVVQLGADARGAIPLALVHRLEEIDDAGVEHAAGRQVVQYRGGIMPLVHAADVLGLPHATSGAEPLQVVVFETEGGNAGLIVERVLDIVTAHESTRSRVGGDADGIAGTMILGGAVTALIDVARLLEIAGVIEPISTGAGR
ncbi:MAG: ATPase [Acidimicrobiia bacterium]|nr:MAG: ATPase [Acidimicrobiia bacterium]